MPFDERYVEHTGPHCAGSCEGAAYQIEIQKLRHDIERLEAERDDHEQARTALEEVVGQLQAEKETLREALEQALEAWGPNMDLDPRGGNPPSTPTTKEGPTNDRRLV